MNDWRTFECRCSQGSVFLEVWGDNRNVLKWAQEPLFRFAVVPIGPILERVWPFARGGGFRDVPISLLKDWPNLSNTPESASWRDSHHSCVLPSNDTHTNIRRALPLLRQAMELPKDLPPSYVAGLHTNHR